MKTSKNKFMMALATFACALLIAIMPMFAVVTHAGDSATTTTSVANVSANGVDVSAQDANLETPVTYSIDVMLTDAYVSSFEMSIRMPNFVDVTAVQESATLARMDKNGVFEYNVDNRGYVNVAYSSSVDFSGITLFTVVFTVNDYTEQYEVIECASCQFVNSAVQEVYANVDLGYISIGSTEIIVMGDVNGDNTVNLADLLIIQRSIVNPDYALTEEQFTVADIDKNGEINIIDCQYIQNYLVGKIDSLENVGASTYTVGVMINDQNGNMLYKGSFVAQSGVPYAEYMTPIFMELSKTYNITGNLSISSKVYGTIDPESSGEGFVIKGDDEIVMVVNVEENSGEEKKIAYTYYLSMTTADGTLVECDYTFYVDGTVRGLEYINGKDMGENWANWAQDGQYIDITFEGETNRLFVVNEDGSLSPYQGGGSEEDKAIVYTYHYAFATESGAKVEFDYTFYNDGTVLGVEFENGVNTGEYWANWAQDGQYIDITFEGETERMFVVNEDGSLSMYDGGGSDVEEPVKIMDYNLSMHELSVACGTSQDALLKELTSAYLTLYYSNGTSEQVAVTADMLDISEVVLDVDGTYSVLVSYYNEEMGFGAEMQIRVTVLPDTSDWEYLDTYTFVCDGENMFGWETFDFYTEAIAINGVDGVEYCQWTTKEDGVVEMTYDDVAVLMQLNADEKTISFYQPSADTLIGAYTFTEGDMQMVFSVYGQYGGAKDYVACVTQTMIGDAGAILRVNITVYVQLDLENSILHPYMIGREFTINEDNTLTMKECEHEWVTEIQAPTCTQEGYERRWCSKCGQGMGTIIEKLDHSYDENGVCANCGAVAGGDIDPEFENYKANRLEEFKMIWAETANKYADYDVTGAYGEQFNYLYETVKSATNTSVVDKYTELFYQMIEEIHAKFSSGGGDVVVDNVNRIDWGVDAIGIPVGSDPSVLMEKVVGTTFEVTYSQSGLVQYVVTEDMVNYGEVVFDTEGEYRVRVSFTAKDGGEYEYRFTVIITPDMSDVEVVGTYKVNVPEDYEMGFDEITLYANNMAFMDGGYYVDVPTGYYVYKENVVAVNMDGGYLVFVLENGVASFYDPATELEAIGTYVISSDYMSLTLIVYGEYTGADDYVSTMIVTQQIDEKGNTMTMTVATIAYLDMENTALSHVMFGDMKFDEKGNLYCPHEETAVDSWEGDCWNNGYRREYCTNCGEEISYETIPAGHDYNEDGVCNRCGNGSGTGEVVDVSEFFAMMDKEWSNLESQYNIYEEYYARYNELKIRLKETTSYEEAEMIYAEEFKMLCNEVVMNCGNAGDRVYLNDWQLVPTTVHVLAGTPVDEFATYFTQTYYVELYFSDGTCEQAPILPEMMHLSELNLDSVGRADLIIDFSYGEHSIGFNLSIYVDPDMTNATASGSFNYADKVVNGMGWDTITLYDNGYAILYCNGDLDEYVEYTLEDGILTYTMYGERMVYMIVDGGVYCYTSEQVIGTYYEKDEGFSITIYGEYTGYGEYYAKFDIIETTDEGMAECFSASTVVILDMENCEIYCGMIGGWMVYDENGNVSPKSESEGEGEEVQKPSTDSDYIYDANGSVSVIA